MLAGGHATVPLLARRQTLPVRGIFSTRRSLPADDRGGEVRLDGHRRRKLRMDARLGLLLSLSALSLASGCCCDLCGDGGGHSCWPDFCRPYEERIDADSSQCGTYCRMVGCGGGMKQWLHNKVTHCKGCGDI